jgi:ribosomal protein S18 acetylase RimI-like enzyme
MSSSSAPGRPRIRAANASDGPLVRDVNLQMLLDSPDAFGESLAEVQGRAVAEWTRFAERCAAGVDTAAFLAEDDQGVCGFVRGDTKDPRTPPGTVLVSQLWTAPRQRGKGLGRELMDAVTRWAAGRRAARICLGVAESNLGVQKFYERLGYADSGIRMPLQPDHQLQVVVMVRPLGS